MSRATIYYETVSLRQKSQKMIEYNACRKIECFKITFAL